MGVADDLHVRDAAAERPAQGPEHGEERDRRQPVRRPESKTAAIAARAPGIIAPYSWPKFPRIPQPIDSESAVNRKYAGRFLESSIAAPRQTRRHGVMTAFTASAGSSPDSGNVTPRVDK